MEQIALGRHQRIRRNEKDTFMNHRRNLSPQQMFIDIARRHVPKYRYQGQPFNAWKDAALPEVMATLGEMPRSCDLNPELVAEWEHDGLRKQKWYIDVSEFISATFQINFPPKMELGRKYPAILCCHGHDKAGKEELMGNVPDKEIQAANGLLFGHELAKQGFITFAIDWIGKGDRNDNQKPNHKQDIGGRDWCNLYYLHATMLGMTSLGINIAHGRAAMDFVSTFSEVDANKIGVMGWSGGGTMSLWMTLSDPRIKATEIISYSDLWECFGIRDLNYCGWQVAPGLYKLVDLPDLQGLLAPRPLLIDIGMTDQCFRIESAMPCFKQVEKIYTAAGARKQLQLNLDSGGHGAWNKNLTHEFFKRYL